MATHTSNPGDHGARPNLDPSATPMVILRDPVTIRALNPPAETLFRCHSADVEGLPLQILFPESRTGKDALVESGSGFTQQMKAHRFDGTVFLAQVSAAYLDFGETECWACLIFPISEPAPTSSRGEETQRLLAILETIPNSIITTDADDNIETFNLASEPLFQYTAEEVIGQNIQLLLPDLSPPRDDQSKSLRRWHSGSSERELTARRKDGTRFPIEMAIGEMDLFGKHLRACVIKDVTARVQAQAAAKEAQNQLIQAEKLASLGSLVAGVAHEINTPVGIAVTAASHLRDSYLSLSTEYRAGNLKRSALEKFFDTCDHASRILDTNLRRASELIQSFKQIAVDQSAGQPRFFAIREYLEELLVSLRPALKKTGHQIHLDCPRALQIYADPGSLSQVLTNLLMNSLTHAYEPGQDGHLRITIEPDEAGIRLVYSDDGKGIPEDAISRIFDPFFTTKRGDGGSGLGLHIVYNIVNKNLSGRISCSSKPGNGTRFEIYMPCPREVE